MTTNTQYHWKEYKRKDYGSAKEYKIANKPKYHEYKSKPSNSKTREYGKVRDYKAKEYVPKRNGYIGYKPEARAKSDKNKLPPKERQYQKMRWFKQIKHCYKLPMGPEYPVNTYKTREYKRKKAQLDYHEYNVHRPFTGYPEYNGSVHYKLTPLNYYGFRRGKRVYRPQTPATVAPAPDWYPLAPVTEVELPQQILTKPDIVEPPKQQPIAYRPLAPVTEITYPQQVIFMPKVVETVVKEKPVYKPIIREDNGFHHLKHPVGYHEYNKHHTHRYRPYQYKKYDQIREYNHLFIYTAKDMPDHKPHILRTEKEIRHITYPEEPIQSKPVEKEPEVKPQKQPKKWRPSYAQEEKLKQQVLIMPKPKPEKVQPMKRIPNQPETEYPSQILFLPTKPIVQEEIQETVVKTEMVLRAAPRYVPTKRELVEESEILIMPIAAKKPRYIPTTKTYVEESATLIAPRAKPAPVKPVEITEEAAEVIKPIVVPLVASAPPKVPPKPKYVPTSRPYVEESVIITMPKPKYVPTSRQYLEESVIITMPKKKKIEIPKVISEPVKTDDKDIQTQSTAPIIKAEKVQRSRTPEVVVAPIVVLAAKQNTTQKKTPKPITPPPQPTPIPVKVEPIIIPEKHKNIPLKVEPKKEPPPPKPVTPPPTPPKPVTPPPKPVISIKPIIVPPETPKVVKEKPKPQNTVVPDVPQPKPVTPQKQIKPDIGPLPVIPDFKTKSPEPKPVEPSPKPNIGPISAIPEFKPTQEDIKPKYTPLPVKPPQPRKNLPKPKPAPKPVETQPVKQVETKPSTPPPTEPPEPTRNTPPKLRTAIRRPSIQRAASPPLEMPPPPPVKSKPKPAKETPAIEMLGALGTVKRTLQMLG